MPTRLLKPSALGLTPAHLMCHSRRCESTVPTRKPYDRVLFYLGVGVVIWACLAAYLAWNHSPHVDEPAHIFAGMCFWTAGRTDIYAVNPPLCRIVASAVAWTTGLRLPEDPTLLPPGWLVRTEVARGIRMLQHWDNWRTGLFVARLVLLPFLLLGIWTCVLWARSAGGNVAAIICAIVLLSSPIVATWSAVIVPDGMVAGLTAAATYCCVRWLKSSDWIWLALGSILMSLGCLTKFTAWLILLGWFLAIPFFCRWKQPRQAAPKMLLSIAIPLLTCLLGINAFYGFRGTATPLGAYEFSSQLLTRMDEPTESLVNRFRGTIFERLPVPLPAEYVHGFDRQASEFDLALGTVVCGRTRPADWKLWYPMAFLFKETTGTVLLAGLALLGLVSQGWRRALAADAWGAIAVAIPLLAALVGTPGAAGHLRYALPAMLPLAVAIAVAIARSGRALKLTAAALCVLSLTESYANWPHPEAFFNVIARWCDEDAPPIGGDAADPGFDYWYLARWYREAGRPQPLYELCKPSLPLELFGLRAGTVPPGPDLPSGWYLVSRREYISRASVAWQIASQGRLVQKAGACVEIWFVPPKPDATSARSDDDPGP